MDNDEPDYVHVTVDGDNYDMTSTQTNYITGATFTKTIECIDLGLTPYPHQFNFSATDGQVAISMELPEPRNKFYIIENQTPNVFTSAPSVVAMKEDDDVKLIPMNQIFEDVDISDGMDFHIWQSRFSFLIALLLLYPSLASHQPSSIHLLLTLIFLMLPQKAINKRHLNRLKNSQRLNMKSMVLEE